MAKPSQRKKLVEVNLKAPVEDAWKVLREPGLIREWFGYYGADYSAWGDSLKTLDDEIKAVFFDDGVEVDEQAHRLKWDGGDEFVLSSTGEDTSLLEVFMVRPASQHELDWKKVYDPICEGWISFVQQLRFFVNRHRDDQRSTIFITGLDAPRVYEMLRLNNLAGVEQGDKYSLQARTGDRLNGIVWYKTHYQIGLTVRAFGRGLLIICATPATAELPSGGCDVLITTFLEGKELEDLSMRWATAFSAPARR